MKYFVVSFLNTKTINFIKGFSYTLSSNLVSLIISILVVLIVPKIIGIEEYGYWQLYLFYVSFVGFLHFGWNDGIYLRYGGKDYKDIDKNLFFSQFYMLFILQIIIGIIVVIITYVFVIDVNRLFIFQMLTLCLLITNTRLMLLFILQCTNRIKEYAQITLMDRMLYCFLIIIFLIFGIREFKLLIVADLIARLISMAYAMYFCKDIVFNKINSFFFSFTEVIENINVGIKLMFANISSMLIIGVVRFGIERSWDVSTFGKVSLTLSIANLMMLFINAFSIVLFPILRRTDEKKLSNIYVTMRDSLMLILLGVLIVYYPLKVIMSAWLPNFSDSLIYMALLFPMCIYEGKMALLINTYLKTLRKEKLLLAINLISLVFSIIFTLITTLILKDLYLAIVSIVILLAFRCILAEFLLCKLLEISLYKDIALELTLVVIFMFTAWFFNSWIVVFLYFIAYLVYLIVKRKDIISTIRNLRVIMRT